MAAGGVISGLVWWNSNLRSDNKRMGTNTENLSKENKVLTLTAKEYKLLSDSVKGKLDSVMAVHKIKPRNVSSGTLIGTNYVDTNKVTATHGTPVELLKIGMKPIAPVWSIPVFKNDSCWGMWGVIISTDPNAKLNILKRTARNNAQLLVLKQRRFLWILWVTRKAEYRMYTDCGEGTFTKIDFIRK